MKKITPEELNDLKHRTFLKVFQEIKTTNEIYVKQFGYALSALEKTKNLLSQEEYRRIKKVFEQGKSACENVLKALTFENLEDEQNPEKVIEKYNKAMPVIHEAVQYFNIGVRLHTILSERRKKDKNFEKFKQAFSDFNSYMILNTQIGTRYELLHKQLSDNKPRELDKFNLAALTIKVELTRLNERLRGPVDLNQGFPDLANLLNLCANNHNLKQRLKNDNVDVNAFLENYADLKKKYREFEEADLFFELEPDNKIYYKNLQIKAKELRRVAKDLEEKAKKLEKFIQSIQDHISDNPGFDPFQSKHSFRKSSPAPSMTDFKKNLELAQNNLGQVDSTHGLIPYLRGFANQAEFALGFPLAIKPTSEFGKGLDYIQDFIAKRVKDRRLSTELGVEYLFLADTKQTKSSSLSKTVDVDRRLAELACDLHRQIKKVTFTIGDIDPVIAIKLLQAMMVGAGMGAEDDKIHYKIPADNIELSDSLKRNIAEKFPDRGVGGENPAWWYYQVYLPQKQEADQQAHQSPRPG